MLMFSTTNYTLSNSEYILSSTVLLLKSKLHEHFIFHDRVCFIKPQNSVSVLSQINLFYLAISFSIVIHGVMELDRDTNLTQHRELSDCVVIPPLKYPSVLDTSLVFKDW